MVESSGPLAGIRVLDISSVIMGPMATQILADLGADVITIESPGGDTNRVMASGPHPELGGIALNLLRNKRNVALDLKSTEGNIAVLRIAATSDVFITNLRPDSIARLGLSYPDVASVREDIVYCQAQGFASDTERANDPAYDDIIQAGSGVADAFERMAGHPGLAPTILADKVCGLTIVYAVLAALVHRARTGEGQRVEVPMLDTMKAFMLVEHGADAVAPIGADEPSRPTTSGYKRILTPNRRPQRTTDGWVQILPYTSAHYDALFRVGGRDDLLGDSRYASMRACIVNSDFLYQAVQAITPQRSTDEWLAICIRHQIPCTRVAALDDLVAELPIEQHPVAGPYRVVPFPLRFSRTPSAGVRRPAPLIGEHTDEVLAEVDVKPADLTAAGRSHDS